MVKQLRLATPTDASAMLGIYAPFVRETSVSFELDVPSEAEFGARIAKTLETTPWLVMEDAGKVTGYAYAGPHRTRVAYQWSVDVSVYVDPANQRQGVGRDLYTTLFACLQLQGYYNVHAGITLPNPASVAFNESMGFAPVGVYQAIGNKFGEWHDVGWWQLHLRGLDPHPVSPTPLPQLVTTEAWHRIVPKAFD